LLPRHDCSVYQYVTVLILTTDSTPRIKIATAIFVGHAINNKAGCAGPCQAAGHSPMAILLILIQPTAAEAQFAAALLHDDPGKRSE
ncbi:hypothetical protein MUK42_36203, partial [Musa troglodytarum]